MSVEGYSQINVSECVKAEKEHIDSRWPKSVISSWTVFLDFL